ncbi:MAG: hypothetical protein ABJL67_24520 [Sulfitobacter sp.]
MKKTFPFIPLDPASEKQCARHPAYKMDTKGRAVLKTPFSLAVLGLLLAALLPQFLPHTFVLLPLTGNLWIPIGKSLALAIAAFVFWLMLPQFKRRPAPNTTGPKALYLGLACQTVGACTLAYYLARTVMLRTLPLLSSYGHNTPVTLSLPFRAITAAPSCKRCPIAKTFRMARATHRYQVHIDGYPSFLAPVFLAGRPAGLHISQPPLDNDGPQISATAMGQQSRFGLRIEQLTAPAQ